jgi:hypothetical protein
VLALQVQSREFKPQSCQKKKKMEKEKERKKEMWVCST